MGRGRVIYGPVFVSHFPRAIPIPYNKGTDSVMERNI